MKNQHPYSSPGFYLLMVASSACGWDDFDPRLAEDPAATPSGNSDGCGTVAVLSNDFEEAAADGGLGPFWRDDSANGAATITDGTLILSFRAVTNTNTDSRGAVYSSHRYNLRESALVFELTRPPTPPAKVHAEVGTPGMGQAGFETDGVRIKAYLHAAGAAATLTPWDDDFDPTAHRFWRLREAGGALHWELSGDGKDWQTVLSRDVDRLFNVDQLRVHLRVIANSLLAGQVHFGAIRGEAEAERLCGPQFLVDNFNDGVRGRPWALEDDTTSSVLELGGTLRIGLSEQAKDQRQGYRSHYAYDLRDGQLMLQVPAVASSPSSDPAAAPAETYVLLDSAAAPKTTVGFLVQGGTLKAILQRPGDTNASIVGASPHDPDAHRWWRVREASSQLIWEVSPDAIAWTEFGSGQLSPETNISALRIHLGGTSNFAKDARVIQFENLNLPPTR